MYMMVTAPSSMAHGEGHLAPAIEVRALIERKGGIRVSGGGEWAHITCDHGKESNLTLGET